MAIDRQLIDRAFSGDSAAFDVIYKDTNRVIVTEIAKIVQGRENIEDVLQQAWLRIVERHKLFEGRCGSTFSTWACVLARHVAYSYHRQYMTQKRDRALTESLDAKLLKPGFQPAARDVSRAVTARMDAERITRTLRGRQKQCTLLWLAGYTAPEVAQKLNLSKANVKSHIFRAAGRAARNLRIR